MSAVPKEKGSDFMLNQLFGSKVRAAILEIILSDPDTCYYSRLLEKTTGMDHKAIWKELNKLEQNGLVSPYQDGKLKRYRVNAFPGKKELTDFILLSTGKKQKSKRRQKFSTFDLSADESQQLTLM